MSKPTLLLSSGGALHEYGRTYGDGDALYTLRSRTMEVAPAGAGGAAMFTAVWLVLTFDIPFRIRVTPILDGVEIWDESVDIENAAILPRRETHIFEMGLSLSSVRDGMEVGRYAMMGKWFQVEISMPCPVGQEGTLIFETIELEYEVISAGGNAQ
jgi:hypothetical protein